MDDPHRNNQTVQTDRLTSVQSCPEIRGGDSPSAVVLPAGPDETAGGSVVTRFPGQRGAGLRGVPEGAGKRKDAMSRRSIRKGEVEDEQGNRFWFGDRPLRWPRPERCGVPSAGNWRDSRAFHARPFTDDRPAAVARRFLLSLAQTRNLGRKNHVLVMLGWLGLNPWTKLRGFQFCGRRPDWSSWRYGSE